MITFIVAIALLIGGYFIYGKFVERVFGADPEIKTPAYTLADGVDYVPMSWWRILLIQFLNIAGLGPVFGAILGAVYGPVAFFWIVFGSIFGGAMHDYLSGMISVRNRGISLPDIIGMYLGRNFMQVMRVVIVVMMILVGAVFVSGPAQLLANLTPKHLDFTFWAVVVFIYYIFATLLPINKIIGKIYPVFGAALLFMAVGVLVGILWNGAPIPEATFANLHNMNPNPDKFPVFPMMFVSIACGAISGFHASQSPLVARCMKNEREGRRVYYGAMIVEALVALIWAAAAMSFFGSVGGLQQFLADHGNNAAVVAQEITTTWMGKFGAFIALLGIIAAPISTGDTSFRSARLLVADFLNYPQKKILNRVLIALPLFVIAYFLLQIDFDIIWRYMSWMNQSLAAVTLWALSVYLADKSKKYVWVTLLPAIFMTMVGATYIMIAPEGLEVSSNIAYPVATVFTIILTVWFVVKKLVGK